jgi:hypothetical protein
VSIGGNVATEIFVSYVCVYVLILWACMYICTRLMRVPTACFLALDSNRYLSMKITLTYQKFSMRKNCVPLRGALRQRSETESIIRYGSTTPRCCRSWFPLDLRIRLKNTHRCQQLPIRKTTARPWSVSTCRHHPETPQDRARDYTNQLQKAWHKTHSISQWTEIAV